MKNEPINFYNSKRWKMYRQEKISDCYIKKVLAKPIKEWTYEDLVIYKSSLGRCYLCDDCIKAIDLELEVLGKTTNGFVWVI